MPLPAVSCPRVHQVDLLRGFALVSIYVNHIPGNAFEWLTHKNFGFSDAAEVFVLLAGFAAAMAWYRGLTGGAAASTIRCMARRAGLLYGCHIATTLAAIALFGLAARLTGWPGYLFDAAPGLYVNLATVVADPAHAAVGLLTGGHQLGYFNILPLYVCLLAMAPGLLVLARAGIGWLLGVSAGLWASAAVFAIDLPNYPNEGGWFFNPLSWQLLFAIGLALGVGWRRGQRLCRHRLLLALAGLYLAFAAVFVTGEMWASWPVLSLPPQLYHFDKTYVSLPRLLHVLALGYVVMVSPLGRWLGRVSPANPLTVMGRHSLPVFCCGSLLAMAAAIVRIERHGGLLVDLAVVIGGLTLQYALARCLDRGRQHPAGAALPAAA